MQLKTAFTGITIGLLALCSAIALAADARTTEAETAIDQYFKAFSARNLKGMVALSTPGIEIMDYGESFALDEWNWYMTFTFKDMHGYEFKLSNFKTRIHDDIAYTSFHMRGGGPEELGNAVLRRVDGKWLIDFLRFEKAQGWHQWLRDRVDKGQVTPDWYREYLQDHPY